MMNEGDFRVFAELLKAIAEVYAKPISDTAMTIYWNALKDYDLDAIRKALDGHVRNTESGQYMPKPADVIRVLTSQIDDGHPGPEEAWAMMPVDESWTVVWTHEMAQAWGVAMPLIDRGDSIGARMSFKEAYARLVSEARANRSPAKWSVSLGFDASKREAVLLAAVTKGRLSAPHVAKLLPNYEMPEGITGMLKVTIQEKSTCLIQ